MKQFVNFVLLGTIILILAAGDFSLGQAISLGLILVIILWFTHKRVRTLEADRIIPYRVFIHPEWHLLLKDYGLVDDEKWAEVVNAQDEIDAWSNYNYNVLRDGVSFTVLRPNLIYSNNRHFFFPRTFLVLTGLRTEISRKLPALGGLGGFGPFPQLYVRLTASGYEIGLITPESFKKLIDDPGSPNPELLAVATLPHEVLINHFPDIRFGSRRYMKNLGRLNLRLTQLDWKQESGSEGLRYEHKYVTVHLKSIV